MHPSDAKALERFERAVGVVRTYGRWVGSVGVLNNGGDTDSAKATRRVAALRVPRKAVKECPKHEPEWDCVIGAWRCRTCARTANDSDNLKGKCRGYGPEVFAGWDHEPDGQHTIWKNARLGLVYKMWGVREESRPTPLGPVSGESNRRNPLCT